MILIARILLFLQGIVVASALGAVITFFGVILVALLFGASDREGGLAMGAAGIAPLGAIAGGILGAWIAWRMITRLSNTTIIRSSFGIVGFVGLLGAGWYVFQEMTDGNPYAAHEEPTVLIEWRLPEKVNHDWLDRIFRYTMRSSYMNWTLSTQWDTPRGRDEGDHTILRMRANIRWRVTGRIFQVWRAPDHDNRITVDLGLPRDPKPMEDFSPWHTVQSAPGNAFRFRVVAP